MKFIIKAFEKGEKSKAKDIAKDRINMYKELVKSNKELARTL